MTYPPIGEPGAAPEIPAAPRPIFAPVNAPLPPAPPVAPPLVVAQLPIAAPAPWEASPAPAHLAVSAPTQPPALQPPSLHEPPQFTPMPTTPGPSVSQGIHDVTGQPERPRSTRRVVGVVALFAGLAAVGATAVWFVLGGGGEAALARADVRAIGVEVQAQYAAVGSDPLVAYADGVYVVGATSLGSTVLDPTLTFYPGADAFCVVLNTTAGVSYSYSAAAGLADGSCAPAGATPAIVPSGDLDTSIESSDYWFDLSVGDCLLSVDTGVGTDAEPSPLEEPSVVPCSEPHTGEVYAIAGFTLDAAPDDVTFRWHTWTACEGTLFQEYVGGPFLASSLNYTVLYPTAEAWGAGANHLVCILVSVEGDQAGSLRGSEALLEE